MNNMLDNLDKFVSLLFKLSLAAGAMVLFSYCASIGYVPENLTAGDGIYFSLLAVAFGFMLLMTSLLLGAPGLILWRLLLWGGVLWLRHLRRQQRKRGPGMPVRYKNRLRRKKQPYREDDYLSKGFPRLSRLWYGFACLGLIYVYLIGRKSWLDLLYVATTSILCGLFISLWLATLQTYLRESKRNPVPRRQLRQRRFLWIAPLVMMIAAVVNGRMLTRVTEGSLLMINFRQVNTVVHIKKPWTDMLAAKGITGSASPVGSEYRRYAPVTIKFFVPGKDKLLEWEVEGRQFDLQVPSSDVLVDGKWHCEEGKICN
ncbi:hypothetical protein ACV6RK_001680 [Cronobacter malonaticus]|uniref:hypothetical protein n=2 Tax=Cronobacter malonaticus TaxID=413503 RepID=UPI00029BB9A7|nr:hypothetical protein [Cronobacter malonaticus]CCJ97235.1 hypothetical protein BN130_3812 [Cronobacter malonaticus 507]ELY4125859.1 hypothetical protein [Cronobacter malonaticus]ELY5937757.1 hypothetical protein [Cronobacter malonaticus]ELY6201939.1 hypothetical protein [Cronobacter malonaticus]ELY6256603.1 hypothetical protein [Cronobacter malonaticus]